MFHQANVVPTDIELGDGTVVKDTTLLEYWYQVVLKKMALYLNLKGTDPFPARVRLLVPTMGFIKTKRFCCLPLEGIFFFSRVAVGSLVGYEIGELYLVPHLLKLKTAATIARELIHYDYSKQDECLLRTGPADLEKARRRHGEGWTVL